MLDCSLFFLGSTVLSFLIGLPVHRRLIRNNIIDRPNERSSHSEPTARGGGIAIVFSLLILAAFIFSRSSLSPLCVVLTAATILAAVSFLDDLESLPSSLRFSCHAAAAAAALFAVGWPGITLEISSVSSIYLPNALGLAIAFLWLAGYTNAFNFMDGINGIAGGQAAITGLGMALLAGLSSGEWSDAPILISMVVAGSAVGFLPHNFPKARMFMGDVGSAPLGFLLSTLVLWLARDHGWSLLIPLALLHANFVLDTAITLCRRILRRERWYSAHREHFYQRLVRSGKSHTFVTLCEMGLQIIVLILMVAYLYVSPEARLGLIAAVIILWLSFFAYCEIQFRRFCSNQK